jgi:hypothetical protein
MIKQMSEEFYNKLFHLPPNPRDLETFAEDVLKKFIAELEANKQGVAWNSGFDGVIFTDRSLGNIKSLKQIKEEFLGQESNAGDPAVAQGTGASGDHGGDQEAGRAH